MVREAHPADGTGWLERPQPGKNPRSQDERGNYLDAYRGLKNRIQLRLAEDMDTQQLLEGKELSDKRKTEIRERISAYLDEEENLSPLQKDEIARGLMAEVTGYGPIQPLLEDAEISEVMVNATDQVYIERDGKLELTGIRFDNGEQIRQLIDRIVTPLGRRIDESSPMVDARLPDGSRVNAIIPPLALRGPTITIRKFARAPLGVEDLVRLGTLTPRMAKLLEACVRARLNVVVSGGTGSGKTTTLNVLSSFIPSDERIITIEDAAELQLRQEHVVSLETRPPNIEGSGEINVRQLVKNALRMRPDRIIVGEVRGGETLDMLQAMNTGHDGSLTTAHANSPRDVLSRLEVMCLMAGVELPIRAIREQISAAVDLVVQQSRMRDGTRRLTHITEVQGMEGDVIVLQDLFLFEQLGVDARGRVRGQFRATGIQPRFVSRLEAEGIELPSDLFTNDGLVDKKDLDFFLSENEGEFPDDLIAGEGHDLSAALYRRRHP